MKTIIGKTVSLALALLLCLPPLAAHAESQVQARMAQVYESYRPIEAVITLELDESVGALISPAETFEAVQKLLNASELKVFIKRGAREVPELGFELPYRA